MRLQRCHSVVSLHVVVAKFLYVQLCMELADHGMYCTAEKMHLKFFDATGSDSASGVSIRLNADIAMRAYTFTKLNFHI